MSIRRTLVAFEEQYTQVPNQWVRDTRLSRKARGLLVELMSHRVGWDITIESLVKGGPEGRDGIRATLQELEAAGYLRRERERREDGTLAGTDYEIVDPWAEPTSENPTQAEPTLADPPAKKNISPEDHQEDTPPTPSPADALQVAFDQCWRAWPRKDGKAAALKAFERSVKAHYAAALKGEVTQAPVDPENWAPLSLMVDTVTRFGAAHLRNTAPKFIPYFSTWLNGQRWTDPLPADPTRGAYTPEPKINQPGKMTLPAGHRWVRDEMHQIIGSEPIA